MSVKKVIKLVNNERVNSKLMTSKACDSTSIDVCVFHQDYAECRNYAYDYCVKEDHAGCYNGSDDTCTIDTDACSGAGTEDNNY